MTSASLQQWVSHPESLNRETLYEIRTLLNRYPYCQPLRLLYLKNLYILRDISFGAELRRSVLYISDRRVLFYLIEGDKYKLSSKSGDQILSESSKEELGIDRTLSLIDSFLTNLPEEPLGTTELDYTTDYTAYLMREDYPSQVEEEVITAPKLRGQELIDGFIAKSEAESSSSIKIKPLTEEESKEPENVEELNDSSTEEGEEDDSFFTETLAKIYIKQKRYSKALEIIKKLSLKYPKKNVYFADQIRFLEKLIINANSK
ncbi:tetratricopeptide repeat protein [Bacteroides sp. 224]|uniref:tetratricopeptide repeat protein n=1 Tax=Bacteroides sp. 224 TaxID=2302936 RepID=UPI0013D45074|nr:tetratricopeptide repeat protein [Bacteroides sp. 224]NDV65088.1 tetratricopeptide repeat protein [Bacteroides sp. 224]